MWAQAGLARHSNRTNFFLSELLNLTVCDIRNSHGKWDIWVIGLFVDVLNEMSVKRANCLKKKRLQAQLHAGMIVVAMQISSGDVDEFEHT